MSVFSAFQGSECIFHHEHLLISVSSDSLLSSRLPEVTEILDEKSKEVGQ